MTHRGVRGSFRRILGIGCDAPGCEKQFLSGFLGADVTQRGVRDSVRRMLGSRCDAGEREF